MHKTSIPQLYGGLQNGKILARGNFLEMPRRTAFDIDVNNVDCTSQVAIDIVFDCPTNPNQGELYLYRKSMILRGTGNLPVKYSVRSVVTTTEIDHCKLFGLQPGATILVPTGIESVGFAHDFPNTTLQNFYYVIRIVDQTVAEIRKE